MSADHWLQRKHQQIVPSDAERESVRRALDHVEKTITEKGGQPFRIAQRYPCGSFEKRTMLAGRKEADLVLVLAEAPTSSSLDDLAALFTKTPPVRSADTRYKAVALSFEDGAKVDVLPVAKDGVTAPGSDVPPKLRHALSGIEHVKWLKEAAHGTPLHPMICLLKAFRNEHPTWRPLRSFAIELLVVEMLHGFKGNGLLKHFHEAISQIANGWLSERKLLDPFDLNNDLLANVSEEARVAIASDARSALRHIENDTWSAVFPGAGAVTAGEAPPAPATNLGGRTLA
jgi:hypothetical protein